MSSSRNLARILLPSHCARAFNNSTLPPSLPAIIRFSSSHPEYILRNGNRRQIATANFQFRPNPNNNNVEFHARYSRTLASTTNNGGGIPDDATISNEDMDTYAVAILKPNLNSSAKLSLKNLRIEQILKEAPGTLARDFFSLSPTSLGDAASRKRRGVTSHYSVNSKIHPWFILPRETEIVMSFGCVRAIINMESALIFNAHKVTIKQQALRISECVQKRDHFTLHDGQIVFRHDGKQATSQFEMKMVEEIIREVCTMYNRRIRLYEPIVNSLMDRVTHEAFSPSGLHKLVPVKDSLQHFEMNVKGAMSCITELLSNDEDMLNLLLTEKSIAQSLNQELPLKSHEKVELLLEEYGRQLNSILLEIAYLLQRVQSKQDMVALSLDAYRNRMIRMNLYLTMCGISLAFGTAVAGFFGMNVINGWEEAEGVFEIVVLGSTLLGGGFLGACMAYLNGSRTQSRTTENLNQIEVLNRALSDMPALDYSFDLMLKEDGALTRETFREKIYASEPESIRDSEIDFLFDLLDYSKDNLIDKEDFRPLAEHSSR